MIQELGPSLILQPVIGNPMSTALKKKIVQDLKTFPPELIQEVVDFVEFLKSKRLRSGDPHPYLLSLQQMSLERIWNSDAEDGYDL